MKIFNVSIAELDKNYRAVADDIYTREREEYLYKKYGMEGLIMQDGWTSRKCLEQEPPQKSDIVMSERKKISLSISQGSTNKKTQGLVLEVTF
jgi:hypothetical protein